MNTKKFFYTILVSVIVLCTGCKKDDSLVNQGGLSNQSFLMPLKTGNLWSYRITLFDSLGNVLESYNVSDIVTRDTLINNEKWYFVGSEQFEHELLTNRSDGLWFINYNRTVRVDQTQILDAKYPANINDNWQNGFGYISKLMAKDIVISVPLGIYSCYKYIYTYPGYNDTEIRYYSPGKGIIKKEFYSNTYLGQSYLSARWELNGLVIN